MISLARHVRAMRKGSESVTMPRNIAAIFLLILLAGFPDFAFGKRGEPVVKGIPSNENFETTEGLTLLWELTAQPDNIVFHSPEAELEGMQYLEPEYRWPAVYGTNGTITVTVPRAGWFTPGVVIYDSEIPPHLPRSLGCVDVDLGQESYEMSIDGKVVGRFFPREDDNRQRLYFLKHPVEFKGGEKIVLRTGPTGANVTEDIILLRTTPPIRGRVFELRNVKADYVEIDGKAQARLTWITTWPARCTVEYEVGDRTETVTEEGPAANHRLYLDGLEPGATYRYRIIAPRQDGSNVESRERTFTFLRPTPFGGGVKKASVPLRVENPHDFPIAACPITSGVPFAKGEIGGVERMRLVDGDGKALPVQASVLSRWDDGSVKWALLSFQADVAAERTAVYTLEYGTEVSPVAVETALSVKKTQDSVTINTGPLEVVFNAQESGFPVRGALRGRKVFDEPVAAHVVDGKEKEYDSSNPAELLEVEEAGPVRVVVHSKGHHKSADGESFFAYEARFIFYAGAPFFRAYYAWGNDRETDFTDFQSATLQVPLAGDEEPRWTVGLGGGKKATGDGDLDLRQLRHDSFELSVPSPSAQALKRADGWLDVRSGNAGLTVAVRDFWQLYPKSLTVRGGRLDVGLCPDFPGGTYDNAEEYERGSFYFYLLGGKYKVKQGMKKWHELMFLWHEGKTGAAQHVETTKVFQDPLIAVSPPERYCGTRVFGPLVPAGTGRTDRFDEQCESFGERYLRNREERTLYGMLNFGDSFRSRMKWLNGEYDPAHGFLLMFARTGARKWYFLAEKTARHAIDVDTCHYGRHAGAVYAHVYGHTPGYRRDSEYMKMRDFIWGSPDHSWAEGFCDWYGVSGDRTGLESARGAGDYYARPVFLNNYDYNNCRDSGWHIILSMGVYNLTLDPYYLNEARIVVERVLERQTPGNRGWHRQLMRGHCSCTPRHRGACIYMLAILCRGLENYYEVTGDRRAADAIVGGVDQAIDEMWVERSNSFAGTSCPGVTGQRRGSGGNYPHPVQMLLFAYWHSGRPRYLEIGRRLMEHSRRIGVSTVPWWSKAYYYMDLIERRKAEGKQTQ